MNRSSSARLMLLPSQLSTRSSSTAMSLSLLFELVEVRLLRSRVDALGFPLLRRPLDRLDDVLISRAATQVARQRPADLFFVGGRIVLEQRRRSEHHAGRAKAALQSVLFFESLLERVQLAISVSYTHLRAHETDS